MMDSIEERYEQFRTNAQQFPLVQFGLSCFTWDAATRKFDVECYQFPIFPRFSKIEASELPDRRFLMQPKCLQYIRDHGFDLNKWIDDGISYLSHWEQAQYSNVLKKSAQPEVLRKFDPSVPAIVTADTREFLQDITKEIKKRFASHQSSEKPARKNHRGSNNNASEDEQEDCEEQHQADEDEAKPEPRSSSLQVEATLAKQFLETGLDHGAKGKYRSEWPSAVFLSEPLAPFRRHVLVQHLEKHFPNVVSFDCKADNSGEDVQQNPWRRRVRLVATSSAKEKQSLLDAYEEISRQEVMQAFFSFLSLSLLWLPSHSFLCGLKNNNNNCSCTTAISR